MTDYERGRSDALRDFAAHLRDMANRGDTLLAIAAIADAERESIGGLTP